MANYAARFLPLAFFVMLAYVLGMHVSGAQTISARQPDMMIGKPLPAFSLDMINSREKLTQEQFRGKPHLLNVMASWCGPCKMEHNVLRQFAEANRIPVYAVAWKDAPDDVAVYLQQMGNFYSEVALDPKSELTVALGGIGVPETYLIGADGHIAYVFRGAVNAAILKAQFEPALDALRKNS